MPARTRTHSHSLSHSVSKAHLESAKNNTRRSIYYTRIAEEAARFTKLKKEWIDPDFPPEPSSLRADPSTGAQEAASSSIANLSYADVTWHQPRFLWGSKGAGSKGRAGLGKKAFPGTRGGVAETAAWC